MRRTNRYYQEKVRVAETKLENGDKDTIIKWIYECHIVEWYVTYLLKKRIDDTDVQDKIQEIYLFICEIPQEKWDDLYAQGKFNISAYITGIVHQQIISATSVCYNKYNKYREIEKTQDELFWEIYYEEE